MQLLPAEFTSFPDGKYLSLRRNCLGKVEGGNSFRVVASACATNPLLTC